jgi:hypothetical protein
MLAESRISFDMHEKPETNVGVGVDGEEIEADMQI